MLSPTQITWLAEIAAVAITLDFPPQLLIAVAAMESQWGEKPIGHANYFGMKRAFRHAKFCLVSTHEYLSEAQIARWNHLHPSRPARIVSKAADGRFYVTMDDAFADYDSMADACKDYVWLISHAWIYHRAWLLYETNHNVPSLAAEVAKSYSTSAAYSASVLNIMNDSAVRAAIAKARG